MSLLQEGKLYSPGSMDAASTMHFERSLPLPNGLCAVFYGYDPFPQYYEGKNGIGIGIEGQFEISPISQSSKGGLFKSDLTIMRGQLLEPEIDEGIARSTHVIIKNAKGGTLIGRRHIIPQGGEEGNDILAQVIEWVLKGKEGEHPLAASPFRSYYSNLSVGFGNEIEQLVKPVSFIPDACVFPREVLMFNFRRPRLRQLFVGS